jgi:outer membrane receptor for ferric coprogen and ferric-rhodotorulic acid
MYGQLLLTLFNPLKVILGGRVGSVKADQYNFASSEWVNVLEEKNKLTPFAGIVYSPVEQVAFYASYSELFVPPQPPEHQREDGSILDPRIGSSMEAGVKTSLFNSRLGVNLAYFYLQDDGRAYRVNPGANYFINAGKVENHGIDVEITSNPINGVEFLAGYTWLNTEVTKSSSGDEGLAFSTIEPEHSFKFWGIYNFESGALQGLSAGLGIMSYSTRYAAVTSPERKQGPYSVFSAFASYAFNDHFSLNLNCNNISDTTYYARVGGNGDFFGEPRSVSLTLRARF